MEPDSFEGSFDRLYQVAYRVAYRMTGSREDASDIAQETLARAVSGWKRIENYREPWVARVAGNLSIAYWRRRRLSGSAPAGRPAAGPTSTSVSGWT